MSDPVAIAGTKLSWKFTHVQLCIALVLWLPG